MRLTHDSERRVATLLIGSWSWPSWVGWLVTFVNCG